MRTTTGNTRLAAFHRVDPRLRVLKAVLGLLGIVGQEVSSRRPEVEGTERFPILDPHNRVLGFIA